MKLSYHPDNKPNYRWMAAAEEDIEIDGFGRDPLTAAGELCLFLEDTIRNMRRSKSEEGA